LTTGNRTLLLRKRISKFCKSNFMLAVWSKHSICFAN